MSRKRYRLVGRIETGDLAELYKGIRDDHENVVVKLFLPNTSAPEYARDLAETSRRLADIRDVGILHEVEIGLIKNRLAVIREALDGFNLGVALQRLSTKEVLLHMGVALTIVVQLLDAVHRAHTAGVIHGAITPGNVILSFDGQVAICDFGTLRALEASPALKGFLSRGRSAYRAPELLQGSTPDPLSDEYSLAAIAYELLTLREAIVGTQPTMSVRKEALPPPSRLDRRINSRLDPIIMRALEQQAYRRYKSCQEFGGALRNFLSANGGMAANADVRRFVAELFPNEVTLSLGPALFTEPFQLREVSGADLHPDVKGEVALRSSFSGGAAPGPDETTDADVVERAMAQAPQTKRPSGQRHSMETVRGDPVFQDLAETMAAPEVVGWDAPPAAAPVQVRRSGASPAVSTTSQPGYRARVRVMESLEPSEKSNRDTLPRAPPEPIKDVPTETAKPEPSLSSSTGALGSSFPGRDSSTGARVIRQYSARRRVMGVVAAAAAMAGLAFFALTFNQRHEKERHELPPPRPVVLREKPTPPSPAPVKLVAESAVEHPRPPAEPEPLNGEGCYSIDANMPFAAWIDGQKLSARTQFKRVPVRPGSHHITLEAIRTGERAEFDLLAEAGKCRKIGEVFAPAHH